MICNYIASVSRTNFRKYWGEVEKICIFVPTLHRHERDLTVAHPLSTIQLDSFVREKHLEFISFFRFIFFFICLTVNIYNSPK